MAKLRQRVPRQPATGHGRSAPSLSRDGTIIYLNLRAILPGVSEKDVRVSVQNNQLIIEGERKAPEGFDKNSFTQLAYGKFYTALTLPTGLDVDHVNCRLGNGILEIQVPITEASKPKQIQIQTGEERKAIHA
jgi:HSP20 family protein